MKTFLRHEYDDIGRIYVFDDGSRYYSVTTMLGNTKDQRFLEEWKARIGKERAEAICKIACETGTTMHEILECHLKNEQLKSPPNAYIRNLANQIIPFIDKRVSRVHAVEKEVYSDKYKLAGTADGIVTYNYKLSVLDFKTAKRKPKGEWIQDYLIQLAIYALMCEELTGTPIHYGVLLFAYKQVRSPQREVVVKLDRYKREAIARIHRFYEIIA